MSASLFSSCRSARAPMRVALLVSVASATLACAPDGPVAPAPRATGPSADVVGATTAAKPASTGITIAVVVEPQSALAVSFTTTGKKLRDFALDDNTDPVLPNAITFDKLKPGTYAVQAQPVAGLTLAKIACTTNGGSAAPATDLTSGTATVPLDAGESVGCTFTEVKTWQSGDLVSHSQLHWGDGTTAAQQMLNAHFYDVYASGVLEVGIPGASGFSIKFGSPTALIDYLPANGAYGALTTDLVNPSTTSAGGFGGEVTALQLNIEFSDAGYTLGAAGVRFGDLTLCNETTVAALNGSSVRGMGALANAMLGGAPSSYTFSEVGLLLANVNFAFDSGTPSPWAQTHLVAGPCP